MRWQPLGKRRYTLAPTVVTRPWRDSKKVVARFVEDWLNLQPADGLVEATTNALLFASLDAPDPEDVDPEGRVLIGQLRNETILQHRALLPIVVFLGMGQWVDDRIARVLALLKPDEHRVAIPRATRSGDAWSRRLSTGLALAAVNE